MRVLTILFPKEEGRKQAKQVIKLDSSYRGNPQDIVGDIGGRVLLESGESKNVCTYKVDSY